MSTCATGMPRKSKGKATIFFLDLKSMWASDEASEILFHFYETRLSALGLNKNSIQIITPHASGIQGSVSDFLWLKNGKVRTQKGQTFLSQPMRIRAFTGRE